MSAIEYEGITSVSCSIVGVRFAPDSALEGDGFEPSVPRQGETVPSQATRGLDALNPSSSF